MQLSYASETAVKPPWDEFHLQLQPGAVVGSEALACPRVPVEVYAGTRGWHWPAS